MADPTLVNCQTSFSQTDSTDNNPDLWNDPLWYDSTTLSNNLPEMPVDLSFTSTDGCQAQYVEIDFSLLLDLDNDGIRETRLYNNNTLPAGSTYVDNYPFGGTGQIAVFDGRNVAPEEKYRFKIQRIVNSDNTLTAKLVWTTGITPSLNKIPEFPPGNHKIKWSSWDGCNNEALCQQEFGLVSYPTNGTTAGGIEALHHRIMPNPVSRLSEIFIGGPSISTGYLELTSVLGQSVLRTDLSSNNVALGNIPPGLYGYRIIDNGRLTGLGTLVITE